MKPTNPFSLSNFSSQKRSTTTIIATVPTSPHHLPSSNAGRTSPYLRTDTSTSSVNSSVSSERHPPPFLQYHASTSTSVSSERHPPFPQHPASTSSSPKSASYRLPSPPSLHHSSPRDGGQSKSQKQKTSSFKPPTQKYVTSLHLLRHLLIPFSSLLFSSLLFSSLLFCSLQAILLYK